MAFDPSTYASDTPSETGSFDPDAYLAQPEQTTEQQNGSKSLTDIFMGTLGAGAKFAEANPVTAGLAATGLGTLASKIPGVGSVIQGATNAVVPESVRTIAGAIPQGLQNWASSIESGDVKTLKDLQHQVLQYSKNKLEVPESLLNQIKHLEGKIYKNIPTSATPVNTTPTSGMQNLQQGMNNMVRGTTAAPTMPEAPPSSGNFMQRMTQLADTYLPTASKAASTAGRVLAPVAGVARAIGSVPVALGTYSQGLNTNEQQELARRQQMQPTFTFPQQ